MAQPLCRDGHGYLLDRRHGVTCFELATGRKLWDAENRVTAKARNPHTKVFTYRNIELALSRDGPDCRKMYDPNYAGFFLRDREGRILDEPSPAANVSCSRCR